jgi:hypothetical protein
MTQSHQSIALGIPPQCSDAVSQIKSQRQLAPAQTLIRGTEFLLPLLFEREEQGKIGPAAPALRALSDFDLADRTVHKKRGQGSEARGQGPGARIKECE